MDKRETIVTFRNRLREVMEQNDESQASFSRRVGLDRSTLSQLLDEDRDRLPRAETIIAIASAAQVSIDWLLGLSQEGPVGPEVVQRVLEIETEAGSPIDHRLQRWHDEAAGYRIRYVPSGIPDLLKTEGVIRFEHHQFSGEVSQALATASAVRLAQVRQPDSDMEMCSSLQLLESFARGEGIWRDLPWSVRQEQLEAMAEILDELYPSLRWFLFDGLSTYSVPFTIFGPLRAAVYFGSMYFVLNSTEHVRLLSRYFDQLVRSARVQPPSVWSLIQGLIEEGIAREGGGAYRPGGAGKVEGP
ncbi:MAG: helix-turn-helix transcriptional regulator [Rhodospirillales bacterium]